MEGCGVADRDVRVQVFVLLAMHSVGLGLRRALEMNRAPVSTDACVEGFVGEVELKTEMPTVVLDRAFEVVHQELRRYAGHPRDARCRRDFHRSVLLDRPDSA